MLEFIIGALSLATAAVGLLTALTDLRVARLRERMEEGRHDAKGRKAPR